LSTRPDLTVIGVSTIEPDDLEYANQVAAEWGIAGFPNIADDGGVYIGFGVFGNPATAAISAGGSVVVHAGDIDQDGALQLLEKARSRDA